MGGDLPREAVDGLIRDNHKRKAKEVAKSGSEMSPGRGWPLRESPVVVVDANVLCNDVIYCVKPDRITTLVNAANSGFLHVIAAEHVMAEVASHHVEWATDRGETPERFWEAWSSLYVPLIRVVPSVESDVFINPELDRLALLSEKDNDDRPSAELAILLKGVFLSEDLPATDAVYGGLRSKEDLHAWRQTLGAGGDAGVLRSIFDAGEVSLRLLGGGIVGVARAISKAPPWAQFLIAGAAIAVSFALTARSTKVNSGPANAETRPVKESPAMAAEVILGMADAYSEARQKLIRAGSSPW
jgi:hypothetical protein